MNIFDSSALLCFIQQEAGADIVERELDRDAVCSAANWSEIAQKVIAAGRNWSATRTLLFSYELQIEPVTRADAERAAQLWRRDSGLSLADRLCLATGTRLEATVWTTDTAWGDAAPIRQIR